MPSRSRAAALSVLVGVILTMSATPALAIEVSSSEFVIIQPGDVLADDLYAGAVKVTVEGVIDGDLIVAAGEAVIIEGRVTGSVVAIAPLVEVSGVVDGSLRVSGNDLVLTGDVGGDVVAAVVDADFAEGSVIRQDALVWAWSLSARGRIAGDLEGSQRSLRVAGTIDGDVDVSATRVSAGNGLTVGGDFGYRSNNEAAGLSEATVGGAVAHKTPLPPNLRVRALDFFGSYLLIIFLTVTALAVAWGWPQATRQAIGVVTSRPWSAWWRGAAVLASPLILAGLVGLVLALAPASASFPLLLILVPLVLALAGLVLALGLVAGIPAVGRLGSLLFRRLDVFGAIVAGSVVAGALWLLPLVGFLVPLVVLPVGLGSWILARRPGVTSEVQA